MVAGRRLAGEAAILHVLTGVKQLAADNTAVPGTPSPDNYITPLLHCFHSAPGNLVKIPVIGITVTERRMTSGRRVARGAPPLAVRPPSPPCFPSGGEAFVSDRRAALCACTQMLR